MTEAGKRRRGQPPIGPRKTIVLTAEQWEYIDTLAARWGIARNAAIRRIIHQHQHQHDE